MTGESGCPLEVNNMFEDKDGGRRGCCDGWDNEDELCLIGAGLIVDCSAGLG